MSDIRKRAEAILLKHRIARWGDVHINMGDIDAMMEFAAERVAAERARAVEIAEYAERWIVDWEKRFGAKSVAEAIRDVEKGEIPEALK